MKRAWQSVCIYECSTVWCFYSTNVGHVKKKKKYSVMLKTGDTAVPQCVYSKYRIFRICVYTEQSLRQDGAVAAADSILMSQSKCMMGFRWLVQQQSTKRRRISSEQHHPADERSSRSFSPCPLGCFPFPPSFYRWYVHWGVFAVVLVTQAEEVSHALEWTPSTGKSASRLQRREKAATWRASSLFAYIWTQFTGSSLINA